MISSDGRLQNYPLALDAELIDAAREHGFRIDCGLAAGWHFWRSATSRGEIALAAASLQGPFFLSVEHAGVARELEADLAEPAAKGHAGAFAFPTRDALRVGVSSAYRLGVSLPTFPLEQFEAEVAELGSTETEAIVRRRIGQDRFRRALLDYHEGRCQLTGIDDPELLRASHIIPWAACESDDERLNVHNGLLLSSLWDAAFDCGLVSFADDGTPLLAKQLGDLARQSLDGSNLRLSRLTHDHRKRLSWHRQHLFEQALPR